MKKTPIENHYFVCVKTPTHLQSSLTQLCKIIS